MNSEKAAQLLYLKCMYIFVHPEEIVIMKAHSVLSMHTITLTNTSRASLVFLIVIRAMARSKEEGDKILLIFIFNNLSQIISEFLTVEGRYRLCLVKCRDNLVTINFQLALFILSCQINVEFVDADFT